MMLEDLAAVSAALAATRSRGEKTRLLAELLRSLAPDEREIAVSWLAGVLPNGKLSLGPAAVYAAKAAPAPHATLTIGTAARELEALRATAGKGSAQRRQQALAALFGAATAPEQQFLAGLLLGELRQGALEGVMADAIAAAAAVPAADVRRALMLAGRVAPVANAALEAGSAGLARFRLTLYEPLAPMLASPTDGVDSALAAIASAVLEYKLDGARVQIHKGVERGVRIYSRTGRDVTPSVPEVAAAVAELPAAAAILDGEVLALTRAGHPRPFQDTMRRFGRKLDVAAVRQALPLSLFCFDCLHLNGEDLIDRPLAERHERLASAVPAKLNVPRLVTNAGDAAQEFLARALASGHEGIMVKDRASRYEAGSRGAAWLKVKVAHTLDLVVLAAEWGSGRRQGWLSNLHLGARDPNGGFVMLGKTFKGLTDGLLEWQTQKLKALALDPAARDYVVAVRPELVVEIAFNELQVSRRYPGGLALRFARVVRYRPDKRPEDADTIDTVRQIAAAQGGAAAERSA
jgi:DNA ligase-1